MKRFVVYIAFAAILLYSSACQNLFDYERVHEFTSLSWPLEEVVSFDFEHQDSALKYDLFIDFRHAAEYPYQNFWVFMDLKSPSGKIFKDTLELRLANAEGKWLGKTASGSLISHHVQIAKNKALPELGLYEFKLWNAMRPEQNEAYFHSIGISAIAVP